MSKPFNKWWGVPIGFGSGLLFGVFGAAGATGLIAASKKTRPAAIVTGVSALAGWVTGAVLTGIGTAFAVTYLMKKSKEQSSTEVSTSQLPSPTAAPQAPTDPFVAEKIPGVQAEPMLEGALPYAGLLTPAVERWRHRKQDNAVLLGRGIKIL